MSPPKKLTRAQTIAQTMASMGFRPNWTGDPHAVEYVKDFAEPNGRLGRLAVLFSKDGISQVMDSARLVRFIVTIQGSIDPLIEEVRDRAPKAMQADMLQALAVLEGVQEPKVETSAPCDLCGVQLEEWTVDDQGRIHCLRLDTCENL